MRRVAIVNAGGYGDHSAEKGSYDSFVEIMECQLKQARRRSDDQPAADVRVVRSTEEAIAWVSAYKYQGTIIYVNRGMDREAKKVATEHPGFRVVLFSGRVPEGEVIYVSKAWISSIEQAENIVLLG